MRWAFDVCEDKNAASVRKGRREVGAWKLTSDVDVGGSFFNQRVPSETEGATATRSQDIAYSCAPVNYQATTLCHH